MAQQQLESVRAVFTYMIYESPDKSFQKAQFRNVDTGKSFAVTGKGLPDKKSLMVILYGQWKIDKKAKRFLAMEYYDVPRQTEKDGIIAYLQSLKCQIGEIKATAIYDRFGLSTWDILRDDPYRLTEVKGIGASLVQKIIDAERCKSGLREIVLLFNKANAKISPTQANNLLALFKDPVKEITENPYKACLIEGISFDKADAVADILGFPSDHPERMKAFVTKALNDAAVRGHVCLPVKELVDIMVSRLECSEDQCRNALNAAWQEGFIKTTNKMVYTMRSYEEETTIASEVHRLLTEKMDPITDLEPLIDDYEAANFKLAESQRDAVRTVFKSPLSIITGGPGTGKTTVIKAILNVHEDIYGEDSHPVLLAPTGRAARRMSDATGRSAQTIHSAVGYRGMEIKADMEAELDGNIIIVDECSMMDQYIASVLFKKCHDNTRVVLVGDPDQLPSVGCGNVLLDMIQSGVVPTTKLNVIFRQSGENPIVANAHAINEGKTQLVWNNTFKRLVCPDNEAVFNTAVKFYCRCVAAYGMDNVILLNPQRNNTDISVDEFNKVLQEQLNPHREGKAEMKVGRLTFRVGDKVMQLKNTEIAKNGDVGYIRSINTRPSPDEPEATVYEAEIEFNGDGIHHTYNHEDMKSVDLAYCSTVHKSQGEEYQTVIMVVSKAHPSMLRRNLVYTGITRSKKYVCLISEASAANEPSALDIAISNATTDTRYTNLIPRLRNQMTVR